MSLEAQIVVAAIFIVIATASAMAYICDWPKPKLKYGNIKAGSSIKVYKK